MIVTGLYYCDFPEVFCRSALGLYCRCFDPIFFSLAKRLCYYDFYSFALVTNLYCDFGTTFFLPVMELYYSNFGLIVGRCPQVDPIPQGINSLSSSSPPHPHIGRKYSRRIGFCDRTVQNALDLAIHSHIGNLNVYFRFGYFWQPHLI